MANQGICSRTKPTLIMFQLGTLALICFNLIALYIVGYYRVSGYTKYTIGIIKLQLIKTESMTNSETYIKAESKPRRSVINIKGYKPK